MFFSNTIAFPIITVAVVLIAIVLVVSFLGVKELIPSKNQWTLWGLRVLLLLALVLLALNPFYVEQHPDPDAFNVAVLVDTSGSMHASDLQEGEARIAVVRRAVDLNNDTSLISRLSGQYDTGMYSFSEDVHPDLTYPLELSQGLTAIGDSMETIFLNQHLDSKPLGALVLLSDGISLQGNSMFDVAKQYREAGIPITVVGVGEKASTGDVRIEFDETPKTVTLDEPFKVNVAVYNDLNKPASIEVGFFDKDELIESKKMLLPAHANEEVQFNTQASFPGMHIYRARILNAVAGDVNPSTDIDFAAVDVTEPTRMKVLYLSATMDYNYRFLRMALRNDPELELRSIIQVGDDKFQIKGFDASDGGPIAQAFPQEGALFLEHSVLIVDTQVIGQLSEKAQAGLKHFLTYRGGGIIFLGTPAAVTEAIVPLMPVRKAIALNPRAEQYLELEAEPIFQESNGGSLFTPPAVFLAKQKRAYGVEALSRGGRAVLTTKDKALPVMAIQAYGAGRVAYLGTQHTWRWRMQSEHGLEQHALFWRHLLSWVGAGGKPRVELPLQGSIQSLEAPVPLDLRVRGQDFRLSEDATIRATITKPDGTVLPPQSLVGKIMEPGHFTGASMMDEAGEYKVDYRIDFPGGDTLSHSAYFMGAYTGEENSDLRYRETELRDLARITGGNYYSYRDIDSIDSWAISSKIPMLETRHYWTRTGLFLLIVLIVGGVEWFLRRRIGLR